MDDLITPVITALPFYRVENDYDGSISCANPFYFQKEQCNRDFSAGTITDTAHLPAFIVRIPRSLGVNLTTPFEFKIMKVDSSDEEDVIVDYVTEAIQIITPSQQLQLQSVPPSNLDAYVVDLGFNQFMLIRWVSSVSQWIESDPYEYDENDLVKLDGGVFCWTIDEDGNGSFKLTNNGFQLCDIGDETYFIYNGFKVDDMTCGYRQVSIKFDLPLITEESTRFVSELLDIRDFDVDNTPFHRLEMTNRCALGNIPYGSIYFKQVYYFDRYSLVTSPEYDIRDSKEEDGLGNEKLTFSRITKLFILETVYIPEYIVDFLYFSTQHDAVHLVYPYQDCNKENFTSQYVGKRKLNRDTIEMSRDFDEVNCYAQVEMKFSLLDDLIMTNCCQQLDKNGCIIPSFEIESFQACSQQENIENNVPSVGDSYIIAAELNGAPIICTNEWGSNINQIATWNGVAWDYQGMEEDVLIFNKDDGNEYLSIILGTAFQPGVGLVNIIGWKVYNLVNCQSNTTSSVTISSCVDSTAMSTVLFKQDLDILFSNFGNFSASELNSGIEITGLNSGGKYEFKLRTFNNNCDYGETEVATCPVQVAGSTGGDNNNPSS